MPVREEEDHLAPQARRDLVLIPQDVLAVVLPEVVGHLLGAGNQLVVDQRRLTLPQEAEDVVGATLDRHLRGETSLDEGVAELLDPPGVFRIDQGREPLVAELLQQVRHCAETFERAHQTISRPFSKGLTPHRPSAKRKTGAYSRLLSAYLR